MGLFADLFNIVLEAFEKLNILKQIDVSAEYEDSYKDIIIYGGDIVIYNH